MTKYDPDIHHRRSLRLRGCDYSSTGAYFVTICVQDHHCLFGNIENGRMILNEAGKLADHWWHELKNKYVNINIDHYIIMPNHFHGIIQIVGADLCVCPGGPAQIPGGHTGPPLRIPISKVVQWFKTMTTNQYIKT
jgi:putative transposase